MHQPVINLYHEQVHPNMYQAIPIMFQLLINYDSSICTNIINYCLNHVLNMYLNQNPSSISSSKYDL